MLTAARMTCVRIEREMSDADRKKSVRLVDDVLNTSV